jgi:predicted ribosome quality control (RQC) complex YloA/Tae2 family protein
MDVLFIEAVIAEIAPLIVGASVKKVHQPDADTIILRLWNGRRELRLRLSVAPGASGLYLTENPWINPPAPLRFCQLLRSRLSTLRSIRQVPGDRIALLFFEGPDGSPLRLVVELYGRCPNMILCDGQDRIIDVLHRRNGDEQHTPRRKGAIWTAPPPGPGRYALWDGGVIDDAGGLHENAASWLMRHVHPMPALLAMELAGRMAAGEDPTEALEKFVRSWRCGERSFWTGEVDGVPRLGAFRPVCLKREQVQEFASASQAADSFYARDASNRCSGTQGQLLRIVRRALSRLQRRLDKLHQERVAAADAETWQRAGQLLTANLFRVRKGMTEIDVENFYDPGTTLRIVLDPALAPAANAERLFAKCKKLRRGIDHIERRITETLAEKPWLEALELALEEVGSGEELAVLEEEMQQARLLPRQPQKPKRRPVSGHPGLRRGLSPGGLDLYWGMNSRANDYLVRHVCRPGDRWFHVKDRPGCHLVLKNPRQDQPVPEADILYAASLAAGFSRACEEGAAEVMVAEGRAVHKPKGALPGQVHITGYHSVRVAPRRESGL